MAEIVDSLRLYNPVDNCKKKNGCGNANDASVEVGEYIDILIFPWFLSSTWEGH